MGELIIVSAAKEIARNNREVLDMFRDAYMDSPPLLETEFASAVYDAVVSRTAAGAITGLGLGGWIGGEIAFQSHRRGAGDVHDVGRMMAGIGGSIVGGLVGGWVGAELGKLSYNIDVSVPFADVFNNIGQTAYNATGSAVNTVGSAVTNTAGAASSVAGTVVKTALDIASQHQVAIAVTTTAAAVAGLGYMAYNQLSEEQKKQLADYPASLLEGKNSKQLKEKLTEEEAGLKNNFAAFEDVLQKSEGQNTDFDQLNAEILKQYKDTGQIKIESILELKESYEKVIVDLPEKELEELKGASIALIESVARCDQLRELTSPNKALSQAKQAGSALKGKIKSGSTNSSMPSKKEESRQK
jgi:hypothetical protein